MYWKKLVEFRVLNLYNDDADLPQILTFAMQTVKSMTNVLQICSPLGHVQTMEFSIGYPQQKSMAFLLCKLQILTWL